MMKLIALTGGFGTGKSTVGRLFEDLGIPRIDADVLAHELMQPDRVAWQQIVSRFGEDILTPDRTIDRQKLGEIVFSDPVQRRTLEAIIHPKVREAMHKKIEELRKQGAKRVMLEIPLLFEAGWNVEEPLDAIIVVTADDKTQAERAKKKFGLSEAAIKARIASQLPLEKKAKQATFTVDNNKDPANTKKQVEKVFKQLPNT